jgi:hypothetical protein
VGPQEVSNGTLASLPTPPQQGLDGSLGVSKWDVPSWQLPGNTPVEGGPNDGFRYYASQLTFNDRFRYQVNPDLANSSSQFSQHQTGEACIIPRTVLLNNVTQHESGYTPPPQTPPVRSHYAQYVASLASQNNNPLVYVEERVAAPGTNATTFDSGSGNEIRARIARIESDAGLEDNLRDAQHDQTTGALSGHINWPPDYPLPQGCPQ